MEFYKLTNGPRSWSDGGRRLTVDGVVTVAVFTIGTVDVTVLNAVTVGAPHDTMVALVKDRVAGWLVARLLAICWSISRCHFLQLSWDKKKINTMDAFLSPTTQSTLTISLSLGKIYTCSPLEYGYYHAPALLAPPTYNYYCAPWY